ncbi:MAG: type II toxin-antitoxin system HicA family toxin [Candidatus Jacksonbacteria bacterium]|nr:type II toxin-antitoxin system HicA family toxin [Candidatus Jacksonbacteria bacterium]
MPKITSVSYMKLQKVFELDGFVFDRQSGDHLIYVKLGISRAIVIPMYKEVPVFIIKNNLRTAGITRDRYFELLARV